MVSRTKKRRSLLEKLLDEIKLSRAQLEDCARQHASVYPSSQYAERFTHFSDALQRLVTHRLAAQDWEVDVGAPWRWEAGQQRFRFDYCGTVVFTPGMRAPRMRLAVRMSLDPEKSLESELARLSDEALFYREAADRMTCETSQDSCVVAELP